MLRCKCNKGPISRNYSRQVSSKGTLYHICVVTYCSLHADYDSVIPKTVGLGNNRVNRCDRFRLTKSPVLGRFLASETDFCNLSRFSHRNNLNQSIRNQTMVFSCRQRLLASHKKFDAPNK